MRPDGSGRRFVTRGDAVDVDPAWAPNARRLVFARIVHDDLCSVGSSDPNYEIFSIRRDGTGAKQLTCSAGIDRRPEWSADGKKIVFESYRGGTSGIWLMDPDGAKVRPLLTQPELVQRQSEITPGWDPTGSKVLFSRFTEDIGPTGAWQMFIADLATMQERMIGDTRAAFGISPSLSPDGRKLVFQDLYDHDAHAIFTMRRDGSERRLLFYNGEWSSAPDWQPRN